MAKPKKRKAEKKAEKKLNQDENLMSFSYNLGRVGGLLKKSQRASKIYLPEVLIS